jgi:apolipoprotein N-acyltransferase
LLPGAAPAPARRRKADALPRLRVDAASLRPYAIAAASGVLLALARPPFDLGSLSLVALVPLFVVWRGTGPRRRAGLAFTAGAVYYAVLVSWAWYFGAVAIVPLVAVLAAFWALTGAGVAWLDGLGFRSPGWTAAVWVSSEALWARAPLGGFSWGEVGYALHDSQLARDVASVGGVALVSFLVVALNGLLADLCTRELRVSRAAVTRAVSAVAGLALVVGVIAVVRPEPHPDGKLPVAVLQGNDKNRDLTREEKDAQYLTHSHLRLAARVDEPVDLIIFPESSLSEDPLVDQPTRDAVAGVAQAFDSWVLGNMVADAPDGRAVNLNIMFNPDGTVQGTYAKRHLVPFGERVPFRKFLEKIIPAVDQVPRDFKPGNTAGEFVVAGHDVATVICFESAFGYQIRPLVRDGADVIIVSTNNRSYRRSANSAQHVAISQMRAAETGRPVVQAAISGESAFIDAQGRVTARTGLFERTVLQRTVTTTLGETWYVRFGDWIVFGSLLAVAAAGIVGVLRRRKRADVAEGSMA